MNFDQDRVVWKCGLICECQYMKERYEKRPRPQDNMHGPNFIVPHMNIAFHSYDVEILMLHKAILNLWLMT